MDRVLVAPTEFSISNQDYGKTYNLLNNLLADDLSIDAYVGRSDTPLGAENVHVHELNAGNRLRYWVESYRSVARELRSGEFDLYHHMNLSYRWFNPVLLSGVQAEVPVVIGPCQAGHAIMAEEFNRIVSHALGVSVPRRVTDQLHRAVEGVRDVALDPPRESLFVRTLRTADRIVVVHEEARDFYADLVDESKLEVVPLGVNPAEFEFTEREESASIVAIGSLRRRKGYDVLLDAVKIVSRERRDVRVHVFGDGPQEDALRRRARRHGIEENVVFHGFVDQSVIKDHLSDARAFVHPSRSESFSLVRLEAMASGCPVVVSDTDGASEMVRDGKDGFVVPRTSAEPLAERILELLDDIELAREMGHAARARVEERYDWQSIGRQYLEIYRSLL